MRLYGVVAYTVELRTNEIGVRLALGATQQNVRGLLLRDTLPLVGTGLLLGAAGTLALGRLVASILFELSPRDPATLAAAGFVLSAVALLAGYVPARRAGRLDPIAALRQE
jgi:ABC-type antimicrobial peptide transport system permease subunit